MMWESTCCALWANGALWAIFRAGRGTYAHMWRRRRRKRRRKKASPPLGTTRLLKEEEEGLSVGVRSKGFFPFSPSFAQPRKRPSHFPLSLVFPLCPKTVTQVQERRRDVRRRGRRAVPHLAPPTTTVNSPRDFAAGKNNVKKVHKVCFSAVLKR